MTTSKVLQFDEKFVSKKIIACLTKANSEPNENASFNTPVKELKLF